MIERALIVITALVAAVVAFPVQPATASAGGCSAHVEIGQAGAKCVKSGSETSDYVAGHSDHTYSLRPACGVGGLALCADPATCNIEGHDGYLFNIYEDGKRTPLEWQACLTDQEAKRLGGLTPGLVQHAFERLAWPASDLVVQPPNGKTLVNFDTNFYTTNAHPTTRTVTLLGQQVTIEATPTEYTWHFGSDGGSDGGSDDGDLSSSDPGAPYPDLRIIHRYDRVGGVRPSVDTTYAGRYRVGNGTWRAIPDTLTVPGPAVDLQVVSATPHLVGY